MLDTISRHIYKTSRAFPYCYSFHFTRPPSILCQKNGEIENSKKIVGLINIFLTKEVFKAYKLMAFDATKNLLIPFIQSAREIFERQFRHLECLQVIKGTLLFYSMVQSTWYTILIEQKLLFSPHFRVEGTLSSVIN